MRPSLVPGDRLVVLRAGRPRPGHVVALDDPRHPGRVLVKRVVAVHAGGAVTVRGDNPAASTDSRDFGTAASVRGRALYRYHPAHRVGPVR